MFPSFIIHAKLIGKLILIKYLMMDVSLVESVDIDNQQQTIKCEFCYVYA